MLRPCVDQRLWFSALRLSGCENQPSNSMVNGVSATEMKTNPSFHKSPLRRSLPESSISQAPRNNEHIKFRYKYIVYASQTTRNESP